MLTALIIPYKLVGVNSNFGFLCTLRYSFETATFTFDIDKKRPTTKGRLLHFSYWSIYLNEKGYEFYYLFTGSSS